MGNFKIYSNNIDVPRQERRKGLYLYIDLTDRPDGELAIVYVLQGLGGADGKFEYVLIVLGFLEEPQISIAE